MAIPLPVGQIVNHALGKRLVRKAFGQLTSKSGQLTLQHVEQVMDLAEGGANGKVLQLPGGVDVRRDDDTLVFLPRIKVGKQKESTKEFSYKVAFGGGETTIAVKEIGC